MPIWLKNKLFQKRIIINELIEIFDHEIESKKTLFFRASFKAMLQVPFFHHPLPSLPYLQWTV